MTPAELRAQQQAAAADQLVAIPKGQEAYYKCPKCGREDFKLESTFRVTFDRLEPKSHGLIPSTPELVCSCGRRLTLDETGDSILLRDLKAQVRNSSPAAPAK